MEDTGTVPRGQKRRPLGVSAEDIKSVDTLNALPSAAVTHLFTETRSDGEADAATKQRFPGSCCRSRLADCVMSSCGAFVIQGDNEKKRERLELRGRSCARTGPSRGGCLRP